MVERDPSGPQPSGELELGLAVRARAREVVDPGLEHLVHLLARRDPLARPHDARQERVDAKPGRAGLDHFEVFQDLDRLAPEADLLASFAQRAVERRGIVGIALAPGERELPAVDAVRGPANQDEPELRGPVAVERHDHAGVAQLALAAHRSRKRGPQRHAKPGGSFRIEAPTGSSIPGTSCWSWCR